MRGDVEERLRPGARIEAGDCLELELEASRELHVYVTNEDRAGSSYALFPLPAGTTHRLPGTVAGAAECWTVSSRCGVWIWELRLDSGAR